VIHDLINLLGRLDLPARTAVTELPARLALTLLAKQLLSLRAGLRPTLLTRLRRILRRRPRTRPSWRTCSSSRLSRSSCCALLPASSRMNPTHASRPES